MSSANDRLHTEQAARPDEPVLDAEHYRRQLETVANNATLALFIMDERQQCTYMNPAAEKLTGFTLAEVQGRPLHDVIHHTRPDGSYFPIEECPIDRAFPQNMQEQGEEVFIHKDGTFYPVAFTASPIRESERTVGTIIEVRDIRKEKELERQREELERAKAAFFSNVSHEFRTPLTLMIGPMEDLLAGALTAAQREQMEMIYRNSLRLLKMVNTLLDFSRIEAGRMQPTFEPVDLATYTRELASLFRSAVERAGLRLSIDIAPLPEPVYVDRDMWENVVLNLLSNALKFTFEGEIAVSLAWRGDQVELVVRDTGSGIPEDELPHIFERFHRVRGTRSRTHEGTGIGLALVRELVLLHSGRISAESTVGEGTTFRVTVPTGTGHLPAGRIAAAQPLEGMARGAHLFVEEALRWFSNGRNLPADREQLFPSVQIPPEESQQALPESASGSAPGREYILLADDNADMRDYVCRLLSPRYEVAAVADGEAALEAARARVPDLILADVMMPRLDGFELLRALRADPRTRGVPVVLLSARAGEESRIQGLETGADDYITKPFSAREVLARVGTHLEMARVRREARVQLEKLNENLERRVSERTAALERANVQLREEVDERVRAEKEIERMNAALKQSNRELQDFAYVASHDLQEPLRKISSFADLLRAECQDLVGESGNHYIERIQDAAIRMSTLIRDLLAYSRVATQGQPFQEVDLNEALAGVLSDLEVRIAEVEGTVEVEPLPCIEADPTQIRQLFQNLISNALKFNREGVPPVICVRAALERSGKGRGSEEREVCRLVVEDNGIGFDEKYLDRIFVPFQRLHGKSSRYEGTGMGLAICRHIAERHGGTITARSTPGEGSTFIVTLPSKASLQAAG